MVSKVQGGSSNAAAKTAGRKSVKGSADRRRPADRGEGEARTHVETSRGGESSAKPEAETKPVPEFPDLSRRRLFMRVAPDRLSQTGEIEGPDDQDTWSHVWFSDDVPVNETGPFCLDGPWGARLDAPAVVEIPDPLRSRIVQGSIRRALREREDHPLLRGYDAAFNPRDAAFNSALDAAHEKWKSGDPWPMVRFIQGREAEAQTAGAEAAARAGQAEAKPRAAYLALHPEAELKNHQLPPWLYSPKFEHPDKQATWEAIWEAGRWEEDRKAWANLLEPLTDGCFPWVRRDSRGGGQSGWWIEGEPEALAEIARRSQEAADKVREDEKLFLADVAKLRNPSGKGTAFALGERAESFIVTALRSRGVPKRDTKNKTFWENGDGPETPDLLAWIRRRDFIGSKGGDPRAALQAELDRFFQEGPAGAAPVDWVERADLLHPSQHSRTGLLDSIFNPPELPVPRVPDEIWRAIGISRGATAHLDHLRAACSGMSASLWQWFPGQAPEHRSGLDVIAALLVHWWNAEGRAAAVAAGLAEPEAKSKPEPGPEAGAVKGNIDWSPLWEDFQEWLGGRRRSQSNRADYQSYWRALERNQRPGVAIPEAATLERMSEAFKKREK